MGTARTYDDVTGWLAYQAYVPPDLRVTATARPSERRWERPGLSVHLDVWDAPAATATLVALHGAGGHGRITAPFCRTAQRSGYRAVAPDLPLFGLTDVVDRGGVRYTDWVDLVADLIADEAAHAPVVLLGLSIGGRLAYDAAALAGQRGTTVHGIVATNLLDPRDPDVRRATARHPALAAVSPLLQRLPAALQRVQLPMSLTSRLSRMSAAPGLARACARDQQGGGTRAPLAFLLSWLSTPPVVEPEDFATCPVVLAQPAQDAWTPPALSLRFAERIAAPTRVVLLEGAGHFPVEQPGLDQLGQAVLDMLASAGGSGTADVGHPGPN